MTKIKEFINNVSNKLLSSRLTKKIKVAILWLWEKADTVILYYLPFVALMIGANDINKSLFENKEKILNDPKSINWMIAKVVLICVISIALPVIGIVKKRKPRCTGWGLGILFAVSSYVFTESTMAANPLKENIAFMIVAPLFVYLLYLPGSFLFKRALSHKIYYGFITFVCVFYGILQYFVYAFRGAPIRASDINNLQSAVEISSEYSVFSGVGPQVLAFAILYFTLCVLILIFTKIETPKGKIRIGFGVGFLCLSVLFTAFNARLFDYGVEKRIIKLNYSGYEDKSTYMEVGNVLFFCMDVINSTTTEPDGYSEEKALEILSNYKAEEETGTKKPTVIAIMDESFADFSKLGNLKTNKDYMPFYNSLKENTIKGYVTVSAYGGYSCNSEFEFLTGNTMHFYPMGSAAYTQYVKTPQDSLVNYFKNRGYSTVALAGCSPGVWDLGEAYEYMGFDKKYYSSYFKSGGKIPEYINAKISDKTVFNEIISLYENRDGDDPMFLFATTMQNHSPYRITDYQITIDGIDNNEAQSYLSSIYETDKALEKLISYFSSVDDDVVVVFYGDHYPHIPSFSETLLGSELGSLSTERNADIHSTPYFIWANYDIEEKNEDMSLNYLSNELLEVCGAPKTDFHLYLDAVKAEIPIISSFGYKGKDGKWYRTGEKSPYTKILNEYNIVQYYRVSEKYDQ